MKITALIIKSIAHFKFIRIDRKYNVRRSKIGDRAFNHIFSSGMKFNQYFTDSQSLRKFKEN